MAPRGRRRRPLAAIDSTSARLPPTSGPRADDRPAPRWRIVEIAPGRSGAALERVDEGEALAGGDRSAEPGHVGSVQSTHAVGVGRHVERGDVAEADEPLRARARRRPTGAHRGCASRRSRRGRRRWPRPPGRSSPTRARRRGGRRRRRGSPCARGCRSRASARSACGARRGRGTAPRGRKGSRARRSRRATQDEAATAATRSTVPQP